MTDTDRFIIRSGTGCSFYYLGSGGTEPKFSGMQSAAMRFDSFDEAREVIRVLANTKEGAELLSTMRPVRLSGTRRVKLGPVTTGRTP